MIKEQCCKQVSDSDGWPGFHQCSRQAVVERNGKPYCKIHDPEYIETKRQAEEAKWAAERQVRQVKYNLQNTAVNACKEINPGNPQAVADSIKGMYEALEGLINRFRTAALMAGLTDTYIDGEVSEAEQVLAKVEEASENESNTERS